MRGDGRPEELGQPLPGSRPRRAVFCVLIVLGFIACNGSTATPALPPTSMPTASVVTPDPPATAATSVSLPDDEGAHDAPIEWWYFNGRLTDDAGNQYSYHFVAFQTKATDGVTPHLLQLSWADHARAVHLTAEKPALLTAEPTPGRFDIPVSGWRMRGDGSIYDLTFDVGQYSLDLRAASAKPAALHQDTGLVSLGRAGATFYYSRTRLQVSGAITLAGRRLPVHGVSWMDHQWGDINDQEVGWDWLSLQLEDGSELMAALVWNPDGHELIGRYGTYVRADGSAHSLEAGDIALTALDSWTSPTSDAVYPMGWRLAIGSPAMSVDLDPVQRDAEFGDSSYGPPAYWEGAVSVTGQKEGQAISGVGFVELVGYDPRQTQSQIPPPGR